MIPDLKKILIPVRIEQLEIKDKQFAKTSCNAGVCFRLMAPYVLQASSSWFLS